MTDYRGDEMTSPGFEDRADLDAIPLHSTNLLTLLDSQGIIQYESPAIERLYGFEQDELVGEQVAEYFHPEDREEVVSAFEAVVTSDGPHVEAVEYRHRMADGSYKWIESVASANPTPEGYYVVNSRDITEQKEREHELRAARERARRERDGKEAIRQLLLETSTDRAIADNVCRQLVEDYGCAAAWAVQFDEGDPDQHRTITSHGDDREFRESTVPADGEGSLDEATRRAAEANDTVAVTRTAEESLADRLEECDLTSVHAVPLVHEGVSYGVLTVVRTENSESVTSALVDELAGALAFKRKQHRQEEALTTDVVSILDVELPQEHFLSRLSSSVQLPEGTTLTAEELRPTADGVVPALVRTADADAETLQRATADLPEAPDVDLVTTGDGMPVVRIEVDAPTVGTAMRRHDGVLESTIARGGTTEVTARFTQHTDFGAVVEDLEAEWPEATVRSRTEQTLTEDPPVTVDGLTEKQEDALRAATLAGFFERPQRASAEAVAETLGVTQSTFLHHLRRAEQKVFAETFGRDTD